MSLELANWMGAVLAVSAALSSGACIVDHAVLGLVDASSGAEGDGAGAAGRAGNEAGGADAGAVVSDGASQSGADAAASCPGDPNAVEGAPCGSRQRPCSLCANLDCCPELLTCFSGTWQRSEAGPCSDAASTFACGDKTCSASEYCVDESGATNPTHSYSCVPIPASCTAVATCGCVVPYSNDAGWVPGRMNICTDPWPGHGGHYGGCSDDGAGHVRVQCVVP